MEGVPPLAKNLLIPQQEKFSLVKTLPQNFYFSPLKVISQFSCYNPIKTLLLAAAIAAVQFLFRLILSAHIGQANFDFN